MQKIRADIDSFATDSLFYCRQTNQTQANQKKKCCKREQDYVTYERLRRIKCDNVMMWIKPTYRAPLRSALIDPRRFLSAE